MADRNSARLFGGLFKKLASDPTEENKKWALELWGYTFEYDFNHYQMDCNEALGVLGLAHFDGKAWEYGPKEKANK